MYVDQGHKIMFRLIEFVKSGHGRAYPKLEGEAHHGLGAGTQKNPLRRCCVSLTVPNPKPVKSVLDGGGAVRLVLPL